MKYTWTKYNLLEEIDTLNRLKKNKSNKEIHDINRNIHLIEDFIEELEILGDMYSTKEVCINNAKYLNLFSFLREDIMSSKYNEVYRFDYDIKENKRKYSKKEILTTTHDFYKSIDKSIYLEFMKSFKERYNNVVFNDLIDDTYEACTFGIPYLDKTYLVLNKSNELSSLYSSAHEYAHALSFHMNSENLTSYHKSFLNESYSLFFELLFTDYLTKNNFKYAYDYIYNLFVDNISMSYDINEMLNLTDLYNEIGCNKNKSFKEEAYKRFGYDKDYIDCINQSDLETLVPYSFGYYVAIELYELYKFDKEKAIYVLKKLILLKNLTSIEYYKEMKKLGINPNSHVSDYINDLKDNLLFNRN